MQRETVAEKRQCIGGILDSPCQVDRHLPETADAVPEELDEEEAELQLYIKY